MIPIWAIPFDVSTQNYHHLSRAMCDCYFKICFLSEVFATQALHLRLQLNGFIKWLNFEIQAQWVTFRCYPEDFGVLIRMPQGKWRYSSHLPMVTEQVCGRKSSLDYFDLGFPSLSCPLSFALFLHFVLLVGQTGCTTLLWSIGAVGCETEASGEFP